jgi:hypothetical protein
MKEATDAIQLIKLSYKNLNKILMGNHNITLNAIFKM